MQLRNKPKKSTMKILSRKCEMEKNIIKMWYFKIVKKEQVDQKKDPTNGVKTPNTVMKEGSLINCNESTTQYLQIVKNKMQFEERNSQLKKLNANIS